MGRKWGGRAGLLTWWIWMYKCWSDEWRVVAFTFSITFTPSSLITTLVSYDKLKIFFTTKFTTYLNIYWKHIYKNIHKTRNLYTSLKYYNQYSCDINILTVEIFFRGKAIWKVNRFYNEIIIQLNTNATLLSYNLPWKVLLVLCEIIG